MQRLAIAILIVGLAALAGAALLRAIRSVAASEAAEDAFAARRREPMQKVAFILLLALILYVSVLGGA